MPHPSICCAGPRTPLWTSCIADAPAEGAPLLAALFPRSYIDPNRHEADIDESLLAEPWPHGARPTGRSERGLGLLRRLLSPTLPIYDRTLGVSEVERRLAELLPALS